MNTETTETPEIQRRLRRQRRQQRREQRQFIRQLKTILSLLTPSNRDRVLCELLKQKFVDAISEDHFPESTQLIHSTSLLLRILNQEDKDDE
jgi:hypothetical protein